MISFLLVGLMSLGFSQTESYETIHERTKAQMLKEYPALGDSNSELSRAVAVMKNQINASTPAFFDDPTFPMTLVQRTVEEHPELEGKARTAQVAAVSNTPASGDEMNQEGFIVAMKEVDHPRSTDSTWRIDVGEVYKFVRYMSSNEFQGSSLPGRDQAYVVAQVDDVQVVAPAEVFAAIPRKDAVTAAIKYGSEVTEYRQSEKADRAEATAIAASRPTQYNGRPLPRNWIDPKQADANFNAQQLKSSIDAQNAQLQQLRQQMQMNGYR